MIGKIVSTASNGKKIGEVINVNKDTATIQWEDGTIGFCLTKFLIVLA